MTDVPRVGKCRNRWSLNYLHPHRGAAHGGPLPAQFVAGRGTDVTGRAGEANIRSTFARGTRGTRGTRGARFFGVG